MFGLLQHGGMNPLAANKNFRIPKHQSKQNGLPKTNLKFTLSCVRLRRAFLFGASLLNLCPGYPQQKLCKHAENFMASVVK